MAFKPGDSYCGVFTTSSPTTGAAANADSLPVATANHNGTDDGAFALAVTNIDTGRYKVTGTIPGGYASGDVVNVSIAATVGGITGKARIDRFQIDLKRFSDLNDISAASVWAAGTRTLSAFGFNVTVGGYAGGQDPATLVLDVAASGHNSAGTIGAKIGASGSSGDPWATSLPGAYSAGTAGAILGNKTGFKLSADGLDQVSIESGINARQALSPILAAAGGTISGAGIGAITVNSAGSVVTPRIAASIDTFGNRTAVTLTLPT